MEDKLKIIYENEDYMVVDKEAGITVNNSDTTTPGATLQDLVNKSGKIDSSDTDEEFQKRSGIVHRLDKETSGVILVAKNSKTFRNLQAQFKERKVQKNYVALVHGEIKPETGEVNVPVGRLPWNRKRFGVLAGGREAITSYNTIQNFRLPKSSEALTLVRLHPQTGRTHQIRVHMKYINHPIFADPLYGGRKVSREDRRVLSRIFLHAEEISILNPTTNEPAKYKSELPIELRELLEILKIKSNN